MIVPFLPALAPAAAMLHAACFPDDPWPEAAFAALLASNAHGFGWVEDRLLVGLVMARDAADESEIITFAVSPASRRRGIGTQLLLALSAHCESHGIASLFLEVAVDNYAAIDLYAAVGFEQVGERSAYYHNGNAPVDALVMSKNFAQRCD